MEYTIICNGIIIASFKNESDRDLCMDFLQDTYEDSSFKKGG